MKNHFLRLMALFALPALLAVAGCSTTSTTVSVSNLDSNAPWVILPLENHTDTPQAALSAEALLEHLLRAQGIAKLTLYPAKLSRDSLFEPNERRTVDEARAWAQGQGAQYALTGSVQEWRYKVGIDGEPSAAMTLQLLDLRSGQVLWSASGAKTGWSRQSLAAVAQKLTAELLSDLPLQHK